MREPLVPWSSLASAISCGIQQCAVFCFLRNAINVMHHCRAPYFRRFGIDFKGHRTPFGAEIGDMCTEGTKCVRDHSLSAKVHMGLLLGYGIRPGGRWSGDYLIADTSTMDNGDLVFNVRALRVNSIIMPPYVIFPVASGTIKQPENLNCSQSE